MLEDKILDTIKQYNLIEPNDTVIVAVSGGPDSMCLLNSLNNLKEKLKLNKIAVAHINHMLREEAKEETEYVRQYCEKKDIEFYAEFVDIKDISRKNKLGEEEAGRKERYAFFEKIAKQIGANKIAIAHNYNDNAETILMHLFRGSGISGLIGIKPYREGKYIRPIIKCTRDEIENYCQQMKLNPRYDKSNNDNTYTRNRIRNELIPYIKEKFNPNIIETLNRLSELVLVDEEYMEQMTENAYNNMRMEEYNDKIVLNLKKFNDTNEALETRIVLYTIKKLFGNYKGIEKIHIESIIKLCNNNIGNKYLMPNKTIKIFIKSGTVSFEKVLK